MPAKRTREESSSSVDVSSNAEDSIIREAVSLASATEVSSADQSPMPIRKRRLADDDVGFLDRFSMRLVSSLQGSSSLDEARCRAREVLVDFQRAIDEESTEMRQKAERHFAANKVLGRALHIMKDKLAEAHASSQTEILALRQQLTESEERTKQAEQAANVLRWHLQHGNLDGGGGGISTPRNIF